MFKLNRIELKKIFLRPAVYVMLFVLAAVLVVSGLLYSNTPRVSPTTNFGGVNQTVSMAFSAFNTSSSVDSKPSLDESLEMAKSAVENFEGQDSVYLALKSNIEQIDYTLSKNDPDKKTFKFALLQYAQTQTESTKATFLEVSNKTALLADNLYKICKNQITSSNIDFYIIASGYRYKVINERRNQDSNLIKFYIFLYWIFFFFIFLLIIA